jgi:hypothetical protein
MIAGVTEGHAASRVSTASRGRGGTARLLVAVLALALIAPHAAAARGRSAIDRGTPLTPEPMTIGFWAGESVPGTDWSSPDTYWNRRSTRLYTPYLWRVLRRNRIPLYFNLRFRRDFGAIPPGQPVRNDALKIIRTANRLGVPVWGWVLIPYADGYWAWEGAASQQFRAVRALVHWARAKHVRLEGLTLDPEPRLLTPFESTAAIMGGDAGASFPSVFEPAIDPAQQCAAWRTYARIPRWARRHHTPVSAAPMPAALDDIGDRSLALQDGSGFILPSAPWHELFFQAYRSIFAYYSGHDPGPGIVSSYLRSARREFGSAGQITLGSTGRGPYRRFASLLHDVRLAATLGARHVPIYSLERTVRAYGGPHSIARLAQAARRPFKGPAATKSTAPTSKARALRAAVRRADRAATGSTPAITAARGAPLQPNAWPGGCGGEPRAR